MTPAIEREAVLPRIDGIRKNLKKLQQLVSLPLKNYLADDDAFDLTQHHLRIALEGVFHISSHILSRLPGGRAVEYKEIARKMGEQKVVPQDFAKNKLVPMAGLRNLLVHVYADLNPQRLYDTVKNHTVDIEEFLKYIKAFLQNPQKFGVTVK